LLATYYAAKDESARRAARDELIDGLVLMIDNEFEYFANRTLSTRAFTNTTLDATAAGLGLSASIVQHSPTAQLLSALGAGVLGLRLSIDKEFFFEQSTPILVAQMKKDRATAYGPIRTGEASSTIEYTLGMAIRDLGAYYQAGTLVHAFGQVLEKVQSSEAMPTKEEPRIAVTQVEAQEQTVRIQFTNATLKGRNVNIRVVGFDAADGGGAKEVLRRDSAPRVGEDGTAEVTLNLTEHQVTSAPVHVARLVITAPTSSPLTYLWQ
jgi:hypothetical protein